MPYNADVSCDLQNVPNGAQSKRNRLVVRKGMLGLLTGCAARSFSQKEVQL